MASFVENLWLSIFTPGPTPTLLLATNATFSALQILLLVLLVVTRSVHFAILSVLSLGLWYSINWFVRELRLAKALEERKKDEEEESEAETEVEPDQKPDDEVQEQPQLLKPIPDQQQPEGIRQRRSEGESASSSGYVSEFTDSEWERVSEGDEIGKDTER